MICPMVSHTEYVCKEDCAWWDKYSDKCAVAVIAANIERVADLLKQQEIDRNT